MLEIKVLGGGCKNCHTLEDRTKEALSDAGLKGNVELITDKDKIVSYGIALTPALVINEKVVSSGKVLTKDKIIKIIKEQS